MGEVSRAQAWRAAAGGVVESSRKPRDPGTRATWFLFFFYYFRNFSRKYSGVFSRWCVGTRPTLSQLKKWGSSIPLSRRRPKTPRERGFLAISSKILDRFSLFLHLWICYHCTLNLVYRTCVSALFALFFRFFGRGATYIRGAWSKGSSRTGWLG